jgi:hypothetical protein
MEERFLVSGKAGRKETKARSNQALRLQRT